MGNAFAKSEIEVIKAQEAEKKSSLGKYLNKYIAPRHLYIIEQVPNLMASCLYHISKPMLVFSSKANNASESFGKTGNRYNRSKVSDR